jgi:PDDEXK-like domain of unknown function (DUF3799)
MSTQIHTALQSIIQSMPAISSPDAGAAGDSYLFKDLPADIYHADRDALSASLIKPLLQSPAHFQLALAQPFKRTDALDFGSLMHLLVLEPHLVEDQVAVFPGVKDGRDADYKAFARLNADKLVVDEDTFALARNLVPKTLERTYKGRSVGKFIEESVCEASLYFKDPTTGLLLRIRPDIHHPDVTFDLKTTRCSTAPEFVRDAVSLHYDLSAFMYSLGRSLYEGTPVAKPFVFIPIESSAPHSVFCVTAGSSFLDNGARKYKECLSLYQACTSTGFWPDMSVEMEAEIEPWQQFQPKPTDWRQAPKRAF